MVSSVNILRALTFECKLHDRFVLINVFKLSTVLVIGVITKIILIACLRISVAL